MKKRLFLSLIMIISLFTFCGCGLITKTPTSVVNDYVNDFKKNLDNDISKPIVSAIIGEKGQKDEDKIKEILKKSLSNINVEIKEEKIEGDNATVSLDITGISLKDVTTSTLKILDSDEFTKEITSLSYDDYYDKVTSIILDSIENAELKTRTCTLSLVKDGSTYVIQNQPNELCIDFWDISFNNLSLFEH